MQTSTIQSILGRDPRVPFRVILADGEEVMVRHPTKAHLSGPYLACAGIGRRNGGLAVERLRVIRVADITQAEVLSQAK